MGNNFDESKHPRASDGKFVDKKAQREWSGAKSGAINPLEEKDYGKATAHAELMYLEIRNRKYDYIKVAKIANITEEDAKEIKEYVFNNEEFQPDFDQAESWKRLFDGNPLEVDLLFIKHEMHEISLRKLGLGYDEAHEITNKKYNYAEEMRKYYYGKIDKKRKK